MSIVRFHVYSGAIRKKIAELHLCGIYLHKKVAGFLVYTRDILV